MENMELKTFNIWDSLDGTVYTDSEDPRMPTNVDYEVMRKRLSDDQMSALYWHSMYEVEKLKLKFHSPRFSALSDEDATQILQSVEKEHRISETLLRLIES